MRLTRFLGFTLLFLLQGGSGRAAAPPVKVALRTSWPAPPLLVEIIETISLERPDSFFPLLDTLTNPDTLPPLPLSPEAVYTYALATAESAGLLPTPASVELGLALHATGPLIEAFYQHYTDTRSREEPPCGGKAWVDWYGQAVCDVDSLVELVTRDTIDAAEGNGDKNDSAQHSSYLRPKILPFDHIYPPLAHTLTRPLRTAILYAALDATNFWDLHTVLFAHAQQEVPHIEYIFRHIPSAGRNSEARSYLSGYGVSLDLKKMDYLALDDRHGHADSTSQKESTDSEGVDVSTDVDPILTLLDNYPDNSPEDPSVPLTEPELLQIALQATQLISSSDSPLTTLSHLAQNFPLYAPLLARRVPITMGLADEVHDNAMVAPAGANMVWINGKGIAETDVSPHALLRLMRKERAIVQGLTSLELTPAQAVTLLTHPALAASQGGGVVDSIFDASDRQEGGGVVVWWNNLEKDSRYARWQSSIQGLLRPLYPGQFHNIKLNLFNVVLVLDLSQSSSLSFLGGAVSNIISRNFPFRWGVVPIVETAESRQMADLFYYLIDRYGRAKTMAFMKEISQVENPHHVLTPMVDMKLVRKAFYALRSREPVNPHLDDGSGPEPEFDVIIGPGGGSVATERMEKAAAYAERLGADTASAPQGHAFVNGKHFDMDDNFLRYMQGEIAQQLQYLQEQLYEGTITEDTDSSISTYFYDLPTTPPRRNRHIYPASGQLRVANLVDVFAHSAFNAGPGRFVYPRGPQQVELSVYVVADLDSGPGLALVKEALEANNDIRSRMRVSFIHNPALPFDASTTERPHMSWFISHLLSKDLLRRASPGRLLKALGLDDNIVITDNFQNVLSQEVTLDGLTGGIKLGEIDPGNYTDYVKASRLVVRALGLASGDQALVVNGRIIGPFQDGELVAEDLKALEAYEIQKRAQPMLRALEDVLPPYKTYDVPSFAHLVSMASSILSSIQVPDPSENGVFNAPQQPRTKNYELLSRNHTAFEFGDNSTALLQVGVLLDPVSEAAQKWSNLLEWLVELPDVFVELHLNPGRYKEVPLKRFYRYNFAPRLSFDEEGLETPAQTIFDGLPLEPIYTLGMDVPPSWLVRPREALHDLDNIQLGSLSAEDRARGVEAVFDLDYLVVEGHARDSHTQGPPRGVQIELTDSQSNAIDDTQVVANLGYLQFKAKPGVFQLAIREGRGRDIFTMESVGNEGWDSPSVDAVGNEITVTSFEGLTLYPRLARRPGMEMEDVLADLTKPSPKPWSAVGDIVSKVSSLFHSKPETNELVVANNDQADINIFTVASGLLYERFVSIMILSVLRNTNSSVKFWFIENFLSPSFLEFIPHLAEAYNFKYELVTYKWPSFIRPQKEKQRIIWAYKILFLDVLFPMDLKKVIFVDADQIVRADLKELVDLDLHGAPYGYTPMGDDNPDMEGFRFWKSGYWKDFLQGRPYHISALYVIDLVRFRQMAAGDMLRQQYQQLSADPNSLANLDQDLPNNLQQQVPIFSLPEDWLWCETWCSKDRLHRAKTIDLCQNPLTKEPKLARARQIPEWEEYDAEIARFARKLADEGLIRSQVAAADANVLANAGFSAAPPADSSTSQEPQESDITNTRDEL